MSERSAASLKAERHLRALNGAWVLSADLAAVIGMSANQLAKVLYVALKQKRVEHARCGKGRLRSWRATDRILAPSSGRFMLKDWPPGFVSKWDEMVAQERAAARE